MRLVVLTFGSEHLASRLYVQWLEQAADADVPRLVRTVRVDAPSARGASLEVLQVVGVTCAVLEGEDDHEDPARRSYWVLRAGAPGQVRVREVPRRPPGGGTAPTSAPPRYPTARDVEQDRGAAAAACALVGPGGR